MKRRREMEQDPSPEVLRRIELVFLAASQHLARGWPVEIVVAEAMFALDLQERIMQTSQCTSLLEQFQEYVGPIDVYHLAHFPLLVHDVCERDSKLGFQMAESWYRDRWSIRETSKSQEHLLVQSEQRVSHWILKEKLKAQQTEFKVNRERDLKTRVYLRAMQVISQDDILSREYQWQNSSNESFHVPWTCSGPMKEITLHQLSKARRTNCKMNQEELSIQFKLRDHRHRNSESDILCSVETSLGSRLRSYNGRMWIQWSEPLVLLLTQIEKVREILHSQRVPAVLSLVVSHYLVMYREEHNSDD
jgi:hypothetical protein